MTTAFFPLPAIPDPGAYRSVCVQVPDEPMHRAAFLGAMLKLTYWYSWDRDPAKKGRAAAAVWWNIWQSVSQQLSDGEGCSENMLFDVRQSEVSPCKLEKTLDGGLTWEEFANIDLCDIRVPVITSAKSGIETKIYLAYSHDPENREVLATILDGTDGLTPIITSAKNGAETKLYLAYDDDPENRDVLATILDGEDGAPGECDCNNFVGGRCDLTFATISGIDNYDGARVRLFTALVNALPYGAPLEALQDQMWVTFGWSEAQRGFFDLFVEHVYQQYLGNSLFPGALITWWSTAANDQYSDMFASLGDDGYLSDLEWEAFLTLEGTEGAVNAYYQARYLWYSMFGASVIRSHLGTWIYQYGGNDCASLEIDPCFPLITFASPECYTILTGWLDNSIGESAPAIRSVRTGNTTGAYVRIQVGRAISGVSVRTMHQFNLTPAWTSVYVAFHRADNTIIQASSEQINIAAGVWGTRTVTYSLGETVAYVQIQSARTASGLTGNCWIDNVSFTE